MEVAREEVGTIGRRVTILGEHFSLWTRKSLNDDMRGKEYPRSAYLCMESRTGDLGIKKEFIWQGQYV